MKLSDFIVMDEKEKKGTLLHEGVLVAKRSSADCLVFLFQLPGFYVESYCNTRTKSIDRYSAFINLDPLHPYLEDIPLDKLLN